LSSYAWSLTSGSGIAAFSGGTTGATATVVTSAAGTFTVQLTLTDSAGAQAVKTQTITVVAAATTTSGAGSSSGGGGGGGGGVSAWWLLSLLGAALMPGRRRRGRACA
jgi:serine protease